MEKLVDATFKEQLVKIVEDYCKAGRSWPANLYLGLVVLVTG
jgi:hypothetical protein